MSRLKSARARTHTHTHTPVCNLVELDVKTGALLPKGVSEIAVQCEAQKRQESIHTWKMRVTVDLLLYFY